MATVLIADRHPATIDAIEAALAHGGIDVLTASTSLGAVRLAELPRVRVVLLDLGLPQVTDVPLFDQLIAAGRDLRVIAMAPNRDVGSAVSYLNQGAVDYLAKPISVAEITARVRAQLRCVALGAEAA